MASSLEDLLAQDGFKGKKLWARSRTTLRTESLPPDQPKRHSVSGDKIRSGRTRSDVNLNGANDDVLTGEDTKGTRGLRDDLLRRNGIVGGSKKEHRVSRLGSTERGHANVREARSVKSNSSDRGHESVWEARSAKSNFSERAHDSVWEARSARGNFSDRGHASMWEAGSSKSNVSDGLPKTEIVEVDDEEYKDIYSNELYRSEGRYGKNSDGSMEKEGFDERLMKLTEEDRRHINKSTTHVSGRASFNDNRKSRKHQASSNERSSRGPLIRKTLEDSHSKKRDKVLLPDSKPALDEIAIKAMVSILSGYIKRFIKEEEFRSALRDSCMSSLNFNAQEQAHAENKVILNLEEAMETIALAAEESADEKDSRKASLQLSVITGLTSEDLKDGYTSGFSNCKLSACAHLYLSVVYKILKKDRVSANHLLQVFCDSPFTARSILLPELWDYLFFPHLSHLKVWYDQEADSLADAQNGPRKLELLGKVYNDILDSGTFQFALYYKDWLTEGIDSPSIPCIPIPSPSSRQVQEGSSHGFSSEMASPAGPQSLVSKKLYDSVFGSSSKTEVDEVEDDGQMDSYEDLTRTPDASAVVVQEKEYSGEPAQCRYRDIEEDPSKSEPKNESLPGDRLSTEPEHQWSSDPLEIDISDQFGNLCKENTEITEMPRQSAPGKMELTQKRVIKSISSISNSSQASVISSIINPVKERSSFDGNYVEGVDLSSIPKDFFCPLTGELFEDPVTLETGQTFERSAIRSWFDEGNTTCPVTGKALESLAVPLTNLILKRVIHNWKSEHCRQLLAYASHVVGTSGRVGSKHHDGTIIFVLEQLLTCFSEKERTENARHLTSIGCLQFLLRRFAIGKEEEKSRVAALLSCCVKADSDCRSLIASSINKQCLVELLQGKDVNIRNNAVLIMTELICLKRKKDVAVFLTGLQDEGRVNIRAIFLEHLQSSLPNQRPFAAVLLLPRYIVPTSNPDLVSTEPQEYSIYRSEAVDAIAESLDFSLTDVNVRENCCKALRILGTHFSISGELFSENSIRKEADHGNGEVNSVDNEEESSLASDTYLSDGEDNLTEYWLRYLTITLLGYGKKSILEILMECLASEHLDLVRMCLITAEWLSRALPLLDGSEFQLAAFSFLAPPLKAILKNSEHVEHKIIASTSVLNFTKISECRVFLMENTDDISIPLQNLAEVTWSAKVLYAIIYEEKI